MITWITRILILIVALSIAAHAQSVAIDHYSTSTLMERAAQLHKQADISTGAASEILGKYPNHFTMLAFRDKSGGAELHKKFADIFFVIDGHATLWTGGSIVDAKTNADGNEVTGTAVRGGSNQKLRPGDVVHIPAGLPHQLILSAGDTFTYFVIKVQQ
ncbi:MAG TPA: hypothetical protein VHX63_04430 [Acidobacteriaceae bacterium]|jgi:mannose-6-phosphate isomerase-like protein (cupin superfamily)|nr:hypothetical protein [Acidobacteriaceae bacterium]